MKREHQLLNALWVREMSLFNLGEINRLAFKRSMELLQTFRPGGAAHRDPTPADRSSHHQRLSAEDCSLSPIDNLLWDEEKEARRGGRSVRQWPSLHTLSLNFPPLWRTINYQGLRGRSKQGTTHCRPSTAAATSVFAKWLRLLGYSHQESQ